MYCLMQHRLLDQIDHPLESIIAICQHSSSNNDTMLLLPILATIYEQLLVILKTK